MGRPKKKQEEVAIEDIELIVDDVVPTAETDAEPVVEPVVENTTKDTSKKVTTEKKGANKKQPEIKPVKKELVGIWKKETNPVTAAVKYRCSNCGRYIVPTGKSILKIENLE